MTFVCKNIQLWTKIKSWKRKLVVSIKHIEKAWNCSLFTVQIKKVFSGRENEGNIENLYLLSLQDRLKTISLLIR